VSASKVGVGVDGAEGEIKVERSCDPERSANIEFKGIRADTHVFVPCSYPEKWELLTSSRECLLKGEPHQEGKW